MDHLPPLTQHRLRRATGADEPFLREVLSATMGDELRLLSPTERAPIVTRRRLQEAWRLRARHHGAESSVILDAAGQRAGHLVVNTTDDAVHLLWLALAPEARGRGLGGSVLLEVQDRAMAAGLPAVCHGAPDDPATILLLRHGFWPEPWAQGLPVWQPAEHRAA